MQITCVYDILVGIPQVIVMTKVDEACPLVNKDLRKLYTSKKIEDLVNDSDGLCILPTAGVVNNFKTRFFHTPFECIQVNFCSAQVGVPKTSIFPVKNYHDEINTNPDVDVLILKALDQIVDSAARRLQKGPYTLE